MYLLESFFDVTSLSFSPLLADEHFSMGAAFSKWRTFRLSASSSKEKYLLMSSLSGSVTILVPYKSFPERWKDSIDYIQKSVLFIFHFSSFCDVSFAVYASLCPMSPLQESPLPTHQADSLTLHHAECESPQIINADFLCHFWNNLSLHEKIRFVGQL